MQNEIEQLKSEKTTLQMSLSSTELLLNKYQEKEVMWHEEIKKRDELLILYEGGNTNVQRNDLLSELDTEKKQNKELLETIEELKRDNSKYRDIIEDYTRQTRRDNSIQVTLHQQQVILILLFLRIMSYFNSFSYSLFHSFILSLFRRPYKRNYMKNI